MQGVDAFTYVGMDTLEQKLKGRRVRFVANVKPSDNDETFGFFSRPRKAELLTTATCQERSEEQAWHDRAISEAEHFDDFGPSDV